MNTITNTQTGDTFELLGTEVVGDITKISTMIDGHLFVIDVTNEEFNTVWQ